eukprot:scaffold1981_cov345-Pinguiococcus_pyrenoidosus.AAC.8
MLKKTWLAGAYEMSRKAQENSTCRGRRPSRRACKLSPTTAMKATYTSSVKRFLGSEMLVTGTMDACWWDMPAHLGNTSNAT